MIRKTGVLVLGVIVAVALYGPLVPAQAQQCALADGLQYPVDTATFQLAQDFAAASPRHQGRYHTGEDWYAGRADNYGLGLPVVAAANGRVTFSSTIGWGRDGGVVIIEHTFADGSFLYTQYGHMMETETIKFPVPFTCVTAGTVIGAVGSARPTPHLHFEVRTQDGTSPGPGYSWWLPTRDGWRRPQKMVSNSLAWQHPAFRWRLSLTDENGPVAPPLSLEDSSLLYLDGQRLERVTPDGRVLWRINLERAGVSISRFLGRPLLTYADGTMQYVNIDGTLAESWQTGAQVGRVLAVQDDQLLFQADDGGLIAYGPDRQQVLWQTAPAPRITRAVIGAEVIGLLTDEQTLLTLTLDGEWLTQDWLTGGGSLALGPTGELLVYSSDGLWAINAAGEWHAVLDNVSPGGSSAALVYSDAGELYLFDGQVMSAYSSNAQLRWQVSLPAAVGGQVRLTAYDSALLLAGNHGLIMALQPDSGGLCGTTQIYGHDHAGLWYALGGDGLLRVAVSDQIIGLDWSTLLGGCR